MIWPPLKAWTSKVSIDGQFHFVAINYGGKFSKRWVILMSVLDSNVVVKALWSQLVDLSNWEPGWNEVNFLESYQLVDNKRDSKNTEFPNPSFDSGLTIPINENTIRPWFGKI
tara:strand:- start:678 stop:1016 length:339 start_codon:yes stop_codon:yes gene_type:complete